MFKIQHFATICVLTLCCSTLQAATSLPAHHATTSATWSAWIPQETLRFVKNNIFEFLPSSFEIQQQKVRFPITQQSGVNGSLAEPSAVFLDQRNIQTSLSLEWLPADVNDHPGIRIKLSQTEIFLDLTAMIPATSATPAAACHVYDLDQPHAAITLPTLQFDIRFWRNEAQIIESKVENFYFPIDTFDDVLLRRLSIEPCDDSFSNNRCSHPQCSNDRISCKAVCQTFSLFTQLGGFVKPVIIPILQEQLPKISAQLAQAITDSLSRVPTYLQTVVPMADFTKPYLKHAQSLEAALQIDDLFVTPRNTAIGLNLNGHFDIAPNITPVTLPKNLTPDVPLLSGRLSNAEPYHLAISFAEDGLQETLNTLFQSQWLQINLSGETLFEAGVEDLTLAGGLILTLDPTASVYGNTQSPLRIYFDFQEAPSIHILSPFETNDNDPNAIFEIIANNLHIHMYMQIGETPTRIAEIQSQLRMRLKIIETNNHDLGIAIKQMKLENLNQLYNELLPETDFARLLKIISDLAISQVIATKSPIQIPVLQQLKNLLPPTIIPTIIGTRKDITESGRIFYSIYTRLCGPRDNDLHCTPFQSPNVRIQSLIYTENNTLQLHIESSSPIEMQFQFPNSAPTDFYTPNENGIIELEHPQLMPGKNIEVMIRYQNAPNTLVALPNITVPKLNLMPKQTIKNHSSCQETSSMGFLVAFIIVLCLLRNRQRIRNKTPHT